MDKKPCVLCDGWRDGENIPIVYSAPIAPNIPPPGYDPPENKKPEFQFINIPANTQMIALVVHDILDGEPVDGKRPGWTHYTALYSPTGILIEEGETSEDGKGWVGPYPEEEGEYHTTAYFLSEPLSNSKFNRSKILRHFTQYGLGSANLVGKYKNPFTE